MSTTATSKPFWLKYGLPSTAARSVLQKLTPNCFLLLLLVTGFNVVVAQTNFTVAGKVTDASGEPLAGATISEKGALANTRST